MQLFSATPLDREERDGYNVTVECRDLGDPPLSASVGVAVRVTDVNDNDPVFAQAVYKGELIENNYIGASIAQVEHEIWLMTMSSLRFFSWWRTLSMLLSARI